MGDRMTFPDTVEEYMEQYKIVDTERVYTNGAELVPIFRMKQWFEHLPSVEAEPVRHGHWIANNYFSMKCDQCGYSISDWRWAESKYCPNCGARMDEGAYNG